MFTSLSCVCLCWISASVLLCGSEVFTSNISTKNQLQNVTVPLDQEDTRWDSPFLQLRTSLPSFSQPIRPYTLLTNTEDYYYMPKPRHYRPSRLLHLLGSSFNSFWMSIEQPSEASGETTLPVKLPPSTTLKERSNLSSSLELKLEEEAAGLDFGSLPPDVASSVRSWLVRSATCELYYQWMDLGPAFWPRWLRQTDCETSDGARSCSFPSGMECVRAQTTHIKILAWHCLEIRGGGDETRQMKSEKHNSSAEVGAGDAVKKKCLWRKVPYPVVTACKCSCK